jgi:transposase
MVLYVKELDGKEKKQLQEWMDCRDAELRHRARIVLLSADGYRVTEIAHLTDSHPANLRKWIHRFNRHSCKGLVTVRAGGAKPRLSNEQKEGIIALARSEPRDLGLNFTSWTLHKLAEQAQERNIVDRISHEYIRQILKAANCCYKHLSP